MNTTTTKVAVPAFFAQMQLVVTYHLEAVPRLYRQDRLIVRLVLIQPDEYAAMIAERVKLDEAPLPLAARRQSASTFDQRERGRRYLSALPLRSDLNTRLLRPDEIKDGRIDNFVVHEKYLD